MSSLVRDGSTLWIAPNRPTRWLSTALAVWMIAAAFSCLVWKDLAGDHVVLRRAQVVDATAQTVTAATDTRAPGHVRRSAPRPAPAPAAGPRVSSATVVDGTVVAIVLVLLVNGAAYLALRRTVRRRRSRARACAGETGSPVVAREETPATAPCEVAAPEPRAEQPRQDPRPRTPVPLARAAAGSDVGTWAAAPRETVLLFDAGEATRVAYTSMVRLAWDDNEICTRTSHVSMRDISCVLPAGRLASLPAPSTLVHLTLRLDGSWATITARASRHRMTADGHVVDLALVELGRADSAALLRVTRNRVDR